MKIIDLTKIYCDFSTKKIDLAGYKSAYPALFSHYFKYWADKNYGPQFLTPIEVKSQTNIVKKALRLIEKQINKYFNISLKDLEIILFVGVNCTNGHAFLDRDGKFKVWVPVESYTSYYRAKIFLTHEINHALHYKFSPKYYFKNKREMINIGNCLATEGLATFFTKKILDLSDAETMFADYISRQNANKLLNDFSIKDKELRKYVLFNYKKSDPLITIFYAGDPSDIYKYKAGYYIGMKIYEQMYGKKNPIDLLMLSKTEFNKTAVEFLKALR